ncbi:uncharacterized protein N0V89_005298 [Didymosphaeria variabile]|uniref:Membrane-associated, eicosanoid/glutathione metabolism (MAPEG) protein n=1 Tax=Didymosphaeria variabile TaxID=1932322 RepID=A0A9W8XMM2_9PLEO|nr:uncharacterized protein N0V89_005298 [Didymosphaeria variabile]KAJ4353568.1 hypothetical protein N0V89_005298 [Didymosphaeria variabile]
MSSLATAIFGDNVNLSIASLPLTIILSALPHWYTIYLASANKVQGGWTNQNPRAFVARLNAKAASGKKLSDLEDTILRGQAAQQNGFEWWGMWAVAVVFGYLMKEPKASMDRYTIIHVASRIVYNILYVSTRRRKYSYLRTAAFQIGLYPAMAIFCRAAKVLA